MGEPLTDFESVMLYMKTEDLKLWIKIFSISRILLRYILIGTGGPYMRNLYIFELIATIEFYVENKRKRN